MARQSYQDLFAVAVASGTPVANTTTETALFPAIAIPANVLADAKTFRLTALGQYSNTGTPTMLFSARLGDVGDITDTLICKSPAITTPSGVTACLWKVEIYLTVRSNGATGTLMGNGTATVHAAVAGTVASATGAASVQPMTAGGVTTPATITENFTIANYITLTLTWSAMSASNTATGLNLTLEQLN